MKQFYALFVFLITFTPAFGSSLVLSNSEDFTCGWTIKVTTTPQTKCKQTLLDGAVSAQAYIGNQKVNGLHYTWYYSGSVTQLGTGQDLTMLEAGSYYVEVQDPVSKCIQRAEATVEFTGEKPWFVVEHVENVLTCNADPYGKIQMRSLNKWKSVWFKGDQVLDSKGITICMSTDVCDDIPPGTYTIVYEDPSSGCRSDPYTLTVEGWPTTPVVNATITADTTCSGTGSGSLSLTAVTPPPGTEPETGYSYVWSNSNGVVLSQFANQAIASPLTAGTYTVEVKGNYSNTDLSCGTTVSFTVPHQPINPIVSATTIPNTICTPPAGGSYNGSITAGATYKGQTVTNFSNYTFTWTNANGATGSVTGTNIINNLPGGVYTVTARNNTLGCISDPVTVEITNQLPVQTLTLSTVAQTNCDNTAPNGSITASYTISPTGTSTPVYKWYRGTTVSAANEISGISGNTATDLAGVQMYTVVVTDPIAGCQITRSIEVPMQQGVVSIIATPTPNAVCAPASSVNGSISITELRFNNTIVADFTGYTFTWSKSVNGRFTTISGQTGPSISGQAAGNYQVTATRTALGCTSDPVTVEIINQLPVQTLTLNPTAQNNCDNTAPNGSITASYTIAPGTATPQLKWYRGTTVSAANEISGISGNTATGLAGGVTYTVVATDLASGCATTASIEVPLQPVVITFDATPAPNAICAPASAANGEITVDQLYYDGSAVTGFSGYTFSWAKEVNGAYTPITVADASSNKLTAQTAGRYQVRVTHTQLKCTSDPVTVEIINQLPVQTLTLNPTAQNNCDNTAPNGSITASYTIAPGTATPQLRWYRGTTVSAANEISGISGNTATGLAGGVTYTVVATDLASGCATTASIEVPLQPVVITFDATPAPNAICAPASAANGEITVDQLYYDGSAVTGFSGYTFSWAKEVNGAYTPITVADASSNKLTAQTAGRYQVRVTHTQLKCTSDPVTVEIINQLPVQTLTLNPTAQNNCDNTAPNGSITASYTIAPGTATPQLRWYRGTTVSAANEISGISGNTATGLAGGVTYTVVATDLASGCATTASIEVPLQPVVITFDATPAPNAICAPASAANGEITVDQLYYDGSAVTGFSGYTFSWAKEVNGAYTPITVADASSNKLTAQTAGRYQVRVTHTQLKCTSDPVTVEIINQLPVQTLTLNPTAQNNCDNTAPNGSITASYTIAPGTATPQLKWYRGTTVSAANEISGISGNTATGLAGGVTYTVVATDLASGCATTASIEVPLQPVVITFDATPAPNAICAPASAANGEITVDQLYYDGSAVTGFSGYTFSWAKEVNGAYTPITVADASSNKLTAQTAGRYQVRVTHTQLKCTSDPVTVEIINQLPVLSLSLTPTSQTSCNNIHNGAITAALNIDGSTGTVITDYTLEWFEGNDISTPLTTATINDNIASKIEGGRYYSVRATHNTSGCQTVAAVYVPASEGTVTLTYGTFANKICNPAYASTNTYDGRINITSVLFNGIVETDLTKYNFTWYKESSGTYSEFANGPALSSQAGLAVGSYQVEVTNIDFGCISNRITIKVEDDPEIHTIELTPTTQIACGAPYTGALAANVQVNGTNATMSDYSFEWFPGPSASGTAISTNLSGINGSTATKLLSGYYTLRVINTSTGCVTTKSIFLEEKLTVPNTQLAVQNITSCDPDDKGLLTASVFENGIEVDYSHYTFRWYKGKTATGTAMADTTQVLDQENDGSMLFTGYYTVVATNLLTRCSAAPQTQYLAPPPPLYLVENSINRYPTDCNEDAGVITAWVNEGGTRNVSDYTFVWYAGRPTNLPATFYSNPEIDFNKPALDPLPSWYDPAVELVGKTPNIDYYLNGATLFGREAGVYTVVITRKGDNCSEYRIIELPYDNGHQALKIATTDSESCDPVGVGSAVVQATDENGVPEADQGEFIFYLFEGTNPGDIEASSAQYIDKQSGVTGQATTTFTGLAPGFYTFLAQETSTADMCKSISKTFEIKQIAMPPVVNAGNITPSTMCDGGNGTASLTVGPDYYEPAGYDDNGNPIPAQQDYATTLFRITWTSVPAGADPASQIPIPAGTNPYVSAGTYPLTGLPTGTYEGYVTGNTGCDTPIKFFIPSQPPLITAVTAVTHQTNCYPENGTITITSVAGGATTDLSQYDFKWMNASGVEIDNTITGPSISDLEAGTYYVVATQKQNTGAGSGCLSAPIEVVINDTSVDPTVELETNPNTSCDPNIYTGEVSIKTPPTGNFTYEWFLVNTNGSTESKGTGDHDNISPIANAAPGLYRIVVEAENGCKVEAEIRVDEQITVPVITKVTATPQNTCDPLLTDASITVEEVTYNGTTYTAPFTNFNFEWKDANGTVITGFTGATITARVTGTYTVEAFRSVNPHKNCYSAPFIITVPYEPVYPAVAFDTNTPNNACDNNYTGALTATVNFTGSYDYNLLLNGAPTAYTGTASSLTSLSFPGLQAGVYTLEIEQLNGCLVSAEITLLDAILKPVITAATASAQTACSTGDGSVAVTGISYNGVPATLADFSFEWYSDLSLSAASHVGSGIALNQQLSQGTYYVVAKKTNTPPGSGCESAPYEVEVLYEPVYPAVAFDTNTPNNACDNNYTGALTATVNFTGSYDYNLLLNGAPTAYTGTASSLTSLSFPGLQAGVYTLEIEQLNGCLVSAEITLLDAILKPVITAATASAQTACSTGDGSVAVTGISYNGVPATLADFSFEWYSDLSLSAASHVGSGIALNQQLSQGTYYVVAKKTNTPPGSGCESAPYEVEVLYEPVYPAVAFNTNTPNNACDNNYTGALTATVNFTGSYDYNLLLNGAPTAYTGTASSLTSLSFPGLQAGVYTLEIEQLNGCLVSAEITLLDAILKPVITAATASAQTACSTGDGSVAVTGISYNGVPATLADFSFEWYSDLSLSAASHVGSGIALNQQLSQGTYYVVAKKTNTPPGSGCESAPYEVEVLYEPVYPAVAFDTNTPNNACDSNYTGALTATVNFTGSYDYNLLLNGAPTAYAGTASTLTNLSFPGLQAGVYTLEIEQLNGCLVSAEITLLDAILKPVITAATASAQTACSTGDGSVAVTGISYNGVPATLADFSFEWYSDLSLSAASHVGSGIALNQQLSQGTYYVVAKKTNTPPGSGCESAPYEVEVLYEPVYPAVAFDTNTPNNACDSNYTGALTATVNFTGSYDYNLLLNGAPTAYAGTASTLTNLSFPGLQAGVYTLEIEQLNGCLVSAEITLLDAILKPVITSVRIAPRTNCQTIGDGELEVDGISYNDISGSLSDYTYEWYDANGISIGSNILKDQLSQGIYYVVAKKTNTAPGSGCESAPYEVEVPYVPAYPAVAVTASVNNTSCITTAANGSFSATVSSFGNYFSYALYKNGAATASDAGSNITNGILSFSGMEEGVYKLEVTAENSCPIETIITLVKEEVSSSLTVSATDQVTCNADGTITVNEISFNGQLYNDAAILANFSLSLLDENSQVLNYTATSTAAGAQFSNLPAGIYTVKATRFQPAAGSVAGQGCSVTYVQAISDVSLAPVIEVVEFNMISACFGNPKGLIQVAVDGMTTNPGNYTASWEYRLNSTDALQPYPGTDFRLINLDPGLYTITVKDINTGCTNTLEFEISEVVVEIAINASANDQTYCQPLDNGELFVRVVNQEEIRNVLGFLPKFDFEVYAGEWATPPGSDYKYDGRNASQFSQLNVSTNTYTVFAWFNGHLVCLGSDNAFVGYVDNTPIPTAQAEAYLTICDPERPNASASANVNGITDGYTFTWYKETIAPANKHHQDGPAVTELSEGKYIVEVYSTITGCTGYTEVEVSAQFPDVPFVDAMLTATSSTSCAAPNGSLEVNVVNRDNFDFTWYRGETADAAQLIPNGPLPYRQDNLPEGTYTVVATDKANGCISNAVSKDLGGDYTYPVYDIVITPANCSTNGTARVVDLSGKLREYYIYQGTNTNGTPLADHNSGTFSGIAGTYTLKVISEDGCDQTRPFEITDVVAPFNGVTANGDGDNDYFHLACIDLFPQNLVRIYNRAGGLVFEMSGYDNSLRVFDGTGNRGLYLGDKQLPAGTYYWVLFRDNVNEKPKTGFLELIR